MIEKTSTIATIPLDNKKTDIPTPNYKFKTVKTSKTEGWLELIIATRSN